MQVKEEESGKEEFLGPLGGWILKGMNIDDALNVSVKELLEQKKPKKKEEPATDARISIHTIDLPDRAPKKLLLDIKKTLEAFPGKEKVQLKIGDQVIPLSLTVNMSMVLEKKIAEVLEEYEVGV